MVAGPNAIPVLKEFGVFEDCLKASGEVEASFQTLLFLDGMGNHDMIYDVRVTFRCHTAYLYKYAVSQYSRTQQRRLSSVCIPTRLVMIRFISSGPDLQW